MKKYTILIFGGTGDLAKKKLIPAILSLAKRYEDFNIKVLGIGKEDYNADQYKGFLGTIELPNNLSINFFKADFGIDGSLDALKQYVESIEGGPVDGRICYMATSYKMFDSIAKQISPWYVEKPGTFMRVVAEKPFGNDLKSSNALNKALKKHFSEERIYRADHYLAKETIDMLMKLRLSNPLFESIWNSKFIRKIRLVVDEDIGVGNRINYYDGAGAVKDMIQNHMLQTVSLVLMEPPKTLEDGDFKDAKVHAMKNLVFKNEISTGQYVGYLDEVKDIHPGSKTETFAEVKLYSKNKRWKGTEITLKTGKMLNKREAYIEIEFKKEPCMMYCNIHSSPNKLIFHIQPIQNIEMTINTTFPGEEMSLMPVKMTFSPTTEFAANTPEAYEVILKDCLFGNRRIFISDKELEAAWRLTDKIIAYLPKVAPVEYAHGSSGLDGKNS